MIKLFYSIFESRWFILIIILTSLIMRLDVFNKDLVGFHAFSAGNSLSEDAIAANFGLLAELFIRAVTEAGIRPQRLVFGSGFGIPYFEGDEELKTSSRG